jgi:hypothetical protein
MGLQYYHHRLSRHKNKTIFFLLSPACHCKARRLAHFGAPGARRGVRGAQPARPSRLVSGTSTSMGGFPCKGCGLGVSNRTNFTYQQPTAMPPPQRGAFAGATSLVYAGAVPVSAPPQKGKTLPGWDAAAERRDAQDEQTSSTAQPRQGRGLAATSMRATALLSTAWAARPIRAGRRRGGGGFCARV